MERQFSQNNSVNVVKISCIFMKIKNKEQSIGFLFDNHSEKL